jgi:hypothetical protein
MSDSSHSWGSMYRHDGMLLRIMFVGLGGGSPFKLLWNADLDEGMTAGLEGGNTVKPRAPGNTSHHDSGLVVGW